MEITELSEFKNMGPHLPTTEYNIPEKEEYRFPTDRPFFIAFVILLILLIPFLIYTLVYSDIGRLDGYDSCGNVCGSKNTKYDEWNCTGQDFTDKKFLKSSGSHKECVASCGEGFEGVYDTCVRSGSSLIYKDLGEDYHARNEFDYVWMGSGSYLSRPMVIFRIILSALIAIGVSFAVLLLFKYAVGCLVWTIIICTLCLSVIFVIVLWTNYSNDESTSKGGSLAICILTTIFVVLYILGVYLGRRGIHMVIILLTEATKAIFTIPSLLIVPIYTLFFDVLIFTISFIITLHITTAGILTKSEDSDSLLYQSNGWMNLTVIFNIFMTLWTTIFVNGMQYMVVGGAVVEWYFSKDKGCLDKPVKKSFRMAHRFHMGTVVFGSLIMLIARLLRYLIQALSKSRITRAIVNVYLSNIERLLKFVTNRAYIITAMHGQPFLKSGKRAAALLANNLSDVITHTLILKLTLFVMVLLIALTTMFLSMLLFISDDDIHVFVAIFIVFIIACYAAVVFVSLFQTTIDTIFMCYCEDKFLNDGIERPYAMSQELMEFVEGSKKAITEDKVSYYVQETVQPQMV